MFYSLNFVLYLRDWPLMTCVLDYIISHFNWWNSVFLKGNFSKIKRVIEMPPRQLAVFFNGLQHTNCTCCAKVYINFYYRILSNIHSSYYWILVLWQDDLITHIAYSNVVVNIRYRHISVSIEFSKAPWCYNWSLHVQ